MLLDEPLSALDLKLRQHMRAELRAIQKRTSVTFIYITHDQGEALAMSDRVGVMSQGVVEQVGTAGGVYNQPGDGVRRLVRRREQRRRRPRARSRAVSPKSRRRSGAARPRRRRPRLGGAATLFVRPERLRPAPKGSPQGDCNCVRGPSHPCGRSPPTDTS